VVSSFCGSSNESPYTDDEDAKTIFRTPQILAASKTLYVPLMLTSLYAIGSFNDAGTDLNAAW
jgi:hypothetical protein